MISGHEILYLQIKSIKVINVYHWKSSPRFLYWLDYRSSSIGRYSVNSIKDLLVVCMSLIHLSLICYPRSCFFLCNFELRFRWVCLPIKKNIVLRKSPFLQVLCGVFLFCFFTFGAMGNTNSFPGLVQFPVVTFSKFYWLLCLRHRGRLCRLRWLGHSLCR